MIALRATLVLAVLAIGASASAVPTVAGTGPLRTGTIAGRVVVRSGPARRSADRYMAGPATAAAPRVQQIPTVVFLRGEIPGGAPPAKHATMAQQDSTFTPGVLVVPAGSTVEFPNRDDFFHNVFSYSSPKRFDLGRYRQGESKSVRFDEPGVVRIYCEVHESMRSAVIVSENPYWAIADDEGRFTIEGVPAGTWELELWHSDRESRTITVDVASGRTTSITVELE